MNDPSLPTVELPSAYGVECSSAETVLPAGRPELHRKMTWPGVSIVPSRGLPSASVIPIVKVSGILPMAFGSTVKVRATAPDETPSWSTARAATVCEPSASEATVHDQLPLELNDWHSTLPPS